MLVYIVYTKFPSSLFQSLDRSAAVAPRILTPTPLVPTAVTARYRIIIAGLASCEHKELMTGGDGDHPGDIIGASIFDDYTVPAS